MIAPIERLIAQITRLEKDYDFFDEKQSLTSCYDWQELKAAADALAQGRPPALVAYMAAKTTPERDAAFLRTYAERLRNGTAQSWEIPNTVASTLEDIATRVEGRPQDAADPEQAIRNLAASAAIGSGHPFKGRPQDEPTQATHGAECMTGHTWTHQWGDDWTPERGAPCDCGTRLWGTPRDVPTAPSRPKDEPTPTDTSAVTIDDLGIHQDASGDWICKHGTAMDVHCCNCHNGFIFDRHHVCPEE